MDNGVKHKVSSLLNEASKLLSSSEPSKQQVGKPSPGTSSSPSDTTIQDTLRQASSLLKESSSSGLCQRVNQKERLRATTSKQSKEKPKKTEKKVLEFALLRCFDDDEDGDSSHLKWISVLASGVVLFSEDDDEMQIRRKIVESLQEKYPLLGENDFDFVKVDGSLTQDVHTRVQAMKDKFMKFLETHCKVRQYMFSILKCNYSDCDVCGPPRSPPEIFAELHHLPDPVPNGERYKSFDDLCGKIVTTEEHLPSKRLSAEKGYKCPFNPSAQFATNVGLTIQCQDCGKWRLLFAQRKLKKKEREDGEAALDSLLYSCGSTMSDVDMGEDDVLASVLIRANLMCRGSEDGVVERDGFSVVACVTEGSG